MATLADLTVQDNGALQLPVGTTAQRPSSPTTGMMRYNTTLGVVETYDGSQWQSFFSWSGTITAQLSSPSRTGPSSISTAYTGDLAGQVTMGSSAETGHSNGIQFLTIPYSGWYRIKAAGAEGGRNSNNRGGGGAVVQGDFWIDAGEILRILCGSPGGENTKEDCDTGGGGGTYVVRTPYNTIEAIMVIAAGGGGGSNTYQADWSGSMWRPDYEGSAGNAGRGNIDAVSGRAGNAGVGGFAGRRDKSNSNRGNPGGGFFSGGDSYSPNPTWSETRAGESFLDGSRGGTPNDGDSYGGWGGGGGGHGNCFISGGGGGGFNGGGSQIQYTAYHGGCGGGSYNSGANQENLHGMNYNESGTPAFGYVYIERIG